MNLCPICGETESGPSLLGTPDDVSISHPNDWPHIVSHIPDWFNVSVGFTCWCGYVLVAGPNSKSRTFTIALHKHLEANGGVDAHFMDHLMIVSKCNLKP